MIGALAHPWALVGALAVAAVWLLWRRWRAPQAVDAASLLLFEGLDLEKAAERPPPRWEMLRDLLVATLLVAAATVPLLPPAVEGNQAQTVIFVLDRSASMAATDRGPSRLGQAVDEARSRLLALAPGTRVGVVAFATVAEWIVPPTSDATKADLALRDLRPVPGATDPGEGLRLARSARSDAAASLAIELFTDVELETLRAVPRPGERIRMTRVGGPARNAAISALRVPESPFAGREAVVVVSNYSESAMNADVSVRADGRAHASAMVAIEPGRDAIVPIPPGFEGATSLSVDLLVDDDLALDDHAEILLSQSGLQRVLLVSDDAELREDLERLLRPVGGFDVRGVPSAAFVADGVAPTDVVVLHAREAPALLPAPTLLLSPPVGGELGAVGEGTDVPVLDVRREHPAVWGALQGGLFDVPHARLFAADGPGTPLVVARVGGEERALVVAGTRDQRRYVLMGIDPRASLTRDGTNVEPVLLFLDAIRWLSESERWRNVAVGRPWPVDGAIFAASGEQVRFSVAPHAGNFETLVDGERAPMRVNLFDARESAIDRSGGGARSRTLLGDPVEERALLASVPIGWELAFAAFALLLTAFVPAGRR